MMIANSELPVVMSSENKTRKYFMPNRPVATPDYSSDSFCSVVNDNSDESSNDNHKAVNVNNSFSVSENNQSKTQTSKEQNTVRSNNQKSNIESKESNNTNNYSYSYSSINSSSSNDREDHDNDVVVSNSVISSYQTSPLSFMSSIVRTNENSITSTKKATSLAHKNETPLAINTKHHTIDSTSKHTDNDKTHAEETMENSDSTNNNNNNNNNINKREDSNSDTSDNSSNNDSNDHACTIKEGKKQINDTTHSSKNDDNNKEFASYEAHKENEKSNTQHEHDSFDNMDDMENVLTSVELPETENICESIREVFVHNGRNAPIKTHQTYPPIEHQALEPEDAHMYNKRLEEEEEEEEENKQEIEELWEEKLESPQEEESKEDTPPLLQNRKLSYKDKGHVQPLCPEQLVEPRHFTPMNAQKEMHKEQETKELEKCKEQYLELQKEEKIDDVIINSNSSSSKEISTSTTSTSSAYSSINSEGEVKQMPSPYASTSSSDRHSESQEVATPVQPTQSMETPLSHKWEQNKEKKEKEEQHLIVSSLSVQEESTTRTTSSTSSRSSSSSSLNMKHKKKMEAITNVPDFRQAHKKEVTNNITSEHHNSTLSAITNNSNNTSSNDSKVVDHDNSASNDKTNEEHTAYANTGNKSNSFKEKQEEEFDTVVSEEPHKISKVNEAESLHTKHLQEQRQLEKELESMQIQGSKQRVTSDNKHDKGVELTDIITQINHNNEKKGNNAGKIIDTETSKTIRAEVVNNTTTVEGTKMSIPECRIRVEPLKTNSLIDKCKAEKVVTGITSATTTLRTNTSDKHKAESNNAEVSKHTESNTKTSKNEIILTITKNKDIAPSVPRNSTFVSAKQTSQVQVKSNAATNTSHKTESATRGVNTHEMSADVDYSKNVITKEQHKGVNKLHTNNTHVERLGKLVEPEHNFTEVRPLNSLREQRVNRLYEVLNKPDIHHNSKRRSHNKVKAMEHHRQEQEQEQQQQRTQRSQSKVHNKNTNSNVKCCQNAQGSALHVIRQRKRHDHLEEEHLPTILTEETGKPSMSIFLEPVDDGMINSTTYYFSVKAIPESDVANNSNENHYYSNHHNVNTLPALSHNRPQESHQQEQLDYIVNHHDANYLIGQIGSNRRVLSPRSRERFRPYNIINAKASVLPPVQANKSYRSKNNKQKMKKRKQRRLQANMPRLRRPLGLLDIPVLEITKYGPDPYAHVLRYNGF